jgi:hypothetical protein
MFHFLFLFIIFLGILNPVHAMEVGEFSGKFEARGGYFLKSTNQNPNSMAQSFLKMEDSISMDAFTVKASPAMTVDVQDAENLNQSRYHFKSSEFWADHTSSEFDVGLGQQMLKWGAADGMNPTNIFKAYDLSDPVFPREISQGAVNLKWHPSKQEQFVMELVYVPKGTVDYLPFNLNQQSTVNSHHSRWGTALPTKLDITQTTQVPLKYAIDGQSHNDSSDIGGRIRLLQMKHWDYSFVLGKFRRKRAFIRYNVRGDASDPTLPLTIHMRAYYPRFTMAGFDASGTIGEVGVRFEAAKYFVDQSSKAYGYDSLIANLGFDYLFSDFVLDSSLYLNAAVIYIDNQKYAQYDKSSIDLAFNRSYGTLRVEVQWDKWSVGQDTLYSLGDSTVFNLYSKHELSDSVTVGLTGSFITGANSGIGRLKDNHRLIGNIEYFF